MKRILLMLMAAMLLMFAGCSKDDDDLDSDLLIGRWRVTHISDGGRYIEITPAVEASIGGASYIIFDADGNFCLTGAIAEGEDIFATYMIKGKTIVLVYEWGEKEEIKVLSLAATHAEIDLYNEKETEHFKMKLVKVTE